MEMSEIIVGGVCIVFVALAGLIHILEGYHLMEWLKRWPNLHNFLMNRGLLLVIGVVGIALLGESIREHRQRKEIHPKQPDCSSDSTGSATASGTGNIAVSGNCNGVTSQPKDAPEQQK
jgi:hypothetical protein